MPYTNREANEPASDLQVVPKGINQELSVSSEGDFLNYKNENKSESEDSQVDKNTDEDSDIVVGEIKLDMDQMEELQNNVELGQEEWRLDPVQVLMSQKHEYGFNPNDEFGVIQQVAATDMQPAQTIFAIEHNDKNYIVFLVQPFPEKGEEGIWAWREVRLNEE